MYNVHIKNSIRLPDVLLWNMFWMATAVPLGEFFLASSEKRGDQAVGNGGTRTCLSHKIHLVGPFICL